jgi:hypothetical protein
LWNCSAFALGAVLLAGEYIARYRLGLGTPPLCLADPLTEYRLRPDQNLKRFGNRIQLNATSMRSAPLLAQRPAGLRRVLVFGDSVVWGGAVLDQDLIATERLRQKGIREVGNVAAPSWGPGNWLGYTRRFGFQQATDVVLVISSHDAGDNPSSDPFRGTPNQPLAPPASALAEGVERYLLPRLRIRLASPQPRPDQCAPPAEPTSRADLRVQRRLADLRAFLTLSRASGARVVAVQFADREEARTGMLQPGNLWIGELLQQEGVPSLQAGPVFRSCAPIDRLYTDGIHPYTDAGQACLARAIQQALAMGSPTQTICADSLSNSSSITPWLMVSQFDSSS